MQTFRLPHVLLPLLFGFACTALAQPQPEYPRVNFSHGQVIEGVAASITAANAFVGIGTTPSKAIIQRKGSVFEMCVYRLLRHAGTATEMVDDSGMLPALPAGDYVVEYSESTSWEGEPAAPCVHKLSRPFTVISGANLTHVFEYYNADLDHYFLTADAYERYLLDTGVIPGWTAAPETFEAFSPDSPASPDLAPVCRFYGRPEAGINSHFYSANSADCQYVIATWPDSWQLETSNAFKVVPAGRCGSENTKMERFYNNQPDANHRYVKFSGISLGAPSIYDQMIQKGWIPESVAWCGF